MEQIVDIKTLVEYLIYAKKRIDSLVCFRDSLGVFNKKVEYYESLEDLNKAEQEGIRREKAYRRIDNWIREYAYKYNMTEREICGIIGTNKWLKVFDGCVICCYRIMYGSPSVCIMKERESKQYPNYEQSGGYQGDYFDA